MASVQDKIELAKLNASKKLFDNTIRLLGQECKVLRIKVIENKYQDETYTVIPPTSNDIIDIIIDFPFDIPLTRYRVNSSTANIDSQGISVYDLLPIDIYYRWKNQEDSTINRGDIEKRDLILYVIEDEGTKIPLLFRVAEILGTIRKSLIFKKGQISPYNGFISSSLQTVIKNYLNNYTF
jgi:hypothetical protein